MSYQNLLQQLLTKYNFTPAKIRGQNFLIDENVLEKIVAAGQITKQETVIEIGPGLGFLTNQLAEQAKKVLALEIDRRAAAILTEELADNKNTEIILGDCLDFNFQKNNIEPNTYLLIANIPYQITSQIFEKFLLGNCPPKRAALLMQREVGERILAKEGEHNFLSVILQTAYQVERVSNVSREKFYPAPKVDSVVVSFEFQQILPAGFADFLRQGFSHSKKKLINNLTILFSKAQLIGTFNLLGIDLAARPGKINPAGWLRLFSELKKSKK